MRIALALLTAGILLLIVSFRMSPYKDEGAYRQAYSALRSGQSDEFWALRDWSVTNKYRLADYGVTLLCLAAGTALARRRGRWRVATPAYRGVLIALAPFAASLWAVAYLYDVLLGNWRDEYPHWADSMGIPMMYAAYSIIPYLAWALLHLLFNIGPYQGGVSLSHAVTGKNPYRLWLLTVSFLAGALLIYCTALGQYWYAVPSAVWIYYYLSLAAGHSLHDPNSAQECAKL